MVSVSVDHYSQASPIPACVINLATFRLSAFGEPLPLQTSFMHAPLQQLDNLRRRKLGDVICDNSDIPATLEKVLRADSGFQACDYRRRENAIQLDLFA